MTSPDQPLGGFGHARWSRDYGRILAVITVAGAILRILLGARQGLGVDEDFTAVAVSHSVDDAIRIVAHDSAPPLFYVLEHLVAGLGAPPWNLRTIPIAAGIALIPLIAALARRVAGDAAGLWAAGFVAVLPAALFTATNARMYGLAATLVVTATLLLWRAVERPAAGRWVAFTVVSAVAVWTDYFAVVALAGVLVAALWLRPSRRVYAVACIAFAVAVASLVPWLLYAGNQLDHAGQGFWVAPISLGGLVGTAGQLFAGPKTLADPPLGNLLFGLQVVAAIGGGLALVGLAVRRRLLDPESTRAAVFCLLACCGVVGLAVVSLWRPLLEARYAGAMWLPLFALAGAGLAVLPRRIAWVLLAAVMVPGLTLTVLVTHSSTIDLLPQVETRLGAHDLVASDPDHYLLLLDQGSPQLAARLHVVAVTDPPWYFGLAAYPADAVVRSVPADVVSNGGLIYYIGNPDTSPAPLPTGYREQTRQCVAGTCLAVYGPGG